MYKLCALQFAGFKRRFSIAQVLSTQHAVHVMECLHTALTQITYRYNLTIIILLPRTILMAVEC